MGFEPVEVRTGAWLDGDKPAIMIKDIAVQDPVVLAESFAIDGAELTVARSWEAARADLSTFVSRALALGAFVLQSTGGRQDKQDLEQIVTEVGRHTVDATTRAAESAEPEPWCTAQCSG